MISVTGFNHQEVENCIENISSLLDSIKSLELDGLEISERTQTEITRVRYELELDLKAYETKIKESRNFQLLSAFQYFKYYEGNEYTYYIKVNSFNPDTLFLNCDYLSVSKKSINTWNVKTELWNHRFHKHTIYPISDTEYNTLYNRYFGDDKTTI